MKDPHVTIAAFCKKNPTLAAAARSLVENRCVQSDESGKFSEQLLRTAAEFKTNGTKTGRYCATLK